jgi:chromosome segregation ATPase
MEQNSCPAKYQTDQEWQEALRDRFDQLHTKISDLSNEATSYKSLSDSWQRKYNEMKQENAILYAKSKNLDELLDELQAKCDKYELALKEISKQSKIDEMDANEVDGDISEGYDAIINVTRNALSAGEGEKVIEKQDQPDFGNCQRCGITKATTTYSDINVCDHCDNMLNNEFDEEYR